MNIENIRKIMKSNLWNKIRNNKCYRNYFILDTHTKENKRVTGQFFVLLVFFHRDIKERTLKNYWKEGAVMSTGEGLDGYSSDGFYGTIKMLRFS